MATWGAHLRIAEKILELDFGYHTEAFLVGNIGPDCGLQTGEWDRFDPPKTVSHWINAQNQIGHQSYYQKYLANADRTDQHRFSFLVGYFVHLISDEAWRLNYLKRKRDQLQEFADFGKNGELTRAVKRDWYDQDYLYLKTNPDNIFYNTFTKIETFPDYLDYFPEGAVEIQMKEIQKFYLNFSRNPFREYKYLTVEEMNDYVNSTTELVLRELPDKKLLLN